MSFKNTGFQKISNHLKILKFFKILLDSLIGCLHKDLSGETEYVDSESNEDNKDHGGQSNKYDHACHSNIQR